LKSSLFHVCFFPNKQNHTHTREKRYCTQKKNNARKRPGIKTEKNNPFYILALIYTSKKWSHRSFLYKYTRENVAAVAAVFSSSSNVHKEKKTNSYVRKREKKKSQMEQ
jgi:hypothetical protein